MQIRQGDLLFEKVTHKPSGTFTKAKDNIIEYGEGTGHAHALATPESAELMVDTATKQVDYLNVLQPAIIGHNTHQPITLNPGTWVVTRQVSLELRERRMTRYVDD